MQIEFEQLKVETASLRLDVDQWVIQDGQSWGIFSTEGDVGSVLGDLLCGVLTCSFGNLSRSAGRVAQVSLAEQQRLLEQEIANDDSDFLDRIDTGTSVYELIFQQCDDPKLTQKLIGDLDLEHLSDSGFRVLSTGETRRVMLARALALRPEFLVLDEPFSGLDVAHRAALAETLAALSKTIQMMVIVSREEELHGWIDCVALFSRGRLEHRMTKAEWDAHPVISQIKDQSKEQGAQMLNLIRAHRHTAHVDDPVFELKNGRVAYTDKVIFSGVNWRINNGEHWQVKGPNGCGKSTLLGLIFGDHPQCYSNDIQIFGKQRGSGETIWDIKRHIGMVSSALHLQYRVSCSALDVILSGFYDSVGLYQKPSVSEQQTARAWLDILHMSRFSKTSFRKLEYGQQRLLLIARALAKRPTLLILDEPYQGLDGLGRKLVKNALELIAAENLSQLLYVSHYQEDGLDSIRNVVEFVPDQQIGGFRAELSQLSV
jgi:molybdate transport system ATP-binding protein